MLAHPLLVFYPSIMEITSPLFWTHLSLDCEKLIYISIYERCVKALLCAYHGLGYTLTYATGSSSVILTGQWSLPIWLAWMWALVMRGAIAAEASQ